MRLLLSRALPLVLASVASARNILLTEQEASDRHLSVQERTCADEHSAVAVSGSGSFQKIGYGIDFTAHVCAAEDGRGHRATGKVFSTAHAENGGHAVYHAHCAYIDKERGFAHLGIEIEDLKGPFAMHLYGEDGERLSVEQSGAKLMLESVRLAAASSSKEGSTGEERKLAKSAKSAKSAKAPKSSNKAPKSTKSSEGVSSQPSSGPSSSSQPSKSPSSMPSSDPSISYQPTYIGCRFRERGLIGTMVDAAEEVISGNEPKGTLAIFRFEKGMDATAANPSAPSADRFAMAYHVAFDTTCEGFEDVFKTVQFMDEDVCDLTKGKFHIP